MISTRSSREERKNNEFRRVFFWQLKQTRLCTLFYTVALLAAAPGMQLIMTISESDYYLTLSNWEDGATMETLRLQFSRVLYESFNNRLLFWVVPLTLGFAVGYCVANFGYMHGRRSVDLFHALPVRRTPLFLGGFAAGLVSLYLPLALAFGLSHCIGLAYRLPAPYSGALIWQAFLLCALMLTAVYTSSVFFCVCSGTLLDAGISILAMNLGWPALCSCVQNTLSQTLPGYCYSLSSEMTTAFSPYLAAFLPAGSMFLSDWITDTEVVYSYDVSLLFVVWWVAFSLVFLGGALFYYTRRKSECAEDHFSAPVIRGVLRFLISAAAGLGLGLTVGEMLDSNLAFVVGIVVGSVAAHVVVQAVLTRTLRRLWQTIPAYALMLGCTALFLAVLYNGGLGFVYRLPAADQVVEAALTPTDMIDNSKDSYLTSFTQFSAYSKNYDSGVYLSPVLTETSDIKTLCDYHEAILDHIEGPFLPFEKSTTGYSTTVEYTLQNGQTLRRRYNVKLSEDTQDIVDAELNVIRLENYNKYNLFPYITVDQISSLEVTFDSSNGSFYGYAGDDEETELTQEQLDTLWSTFIEELNSADFDQGLTYTDWEEQERLNALAEESDAYEEETAIDTAVNAVTLPETLPEDREEGEALFTSIDYTIYLYDVEIDSLPSAMKELILNACDSTETYEKLYYASGTGYLTIPACCTKTRDLMYEYCRGDGEIFRYATEETDEETEDTTDEEVSIETDEEEVIGSADSSTTIVLD